ncbi:glycosyl hydrolase 108 family protein [Flavobacterium sp. CF136]|uniref:glycosyl hydrolase 108 family protein n=1 Tax=Flavobacterium sp. (strain CF136) TaxID=1144313 RepID=UPI0002715B49|nr:glycosyl hydrolase 108 family protein [Flavobacterium sp. CF136]EJL62015.1 putative secretion activating protein [Flavobacterium sp. CF136]
MSDFKITGNPNPVIGKEEFYSIGNPVAKTFPYTAIPKSPFDTPVLWTVHILENGRWRKTKENDKKGDKVSYTFLQRSLGRKGIRIMATRGEQTARLDIDTHPADKPKIDSIDLLDKSGKKPAKPLSYGQTLKARVHCLHMEKRKVFVTLWEDDAKGAGHNKENEKNIIETRWGFVEDGIADVDFLLRPSFAKIATRGGEEKDKIHEYYVTTNFDNEKLASSNVNVNELETPVAPFKGKVPVQQPAKNNAPAQQPKAQAPATPTQAKPKGAISSVKITDADGNAIKGVYRDKQIKVWINSSGLIGKEIRFRLYDEDYVSNDLLVDQKFTITNNVLPIIVTLNKIPRSLGGDTGEGAEQEVFADIEVLETNKHTVSAVVDVDAKAFKPDPVSDSNTVFKIFQPDKEENKGVSCGEKYCIKKGDKSELIREVNIRLAGFGGNVPTDEFTDRTEKMIKQFQRDYMKVPETGKICGNVLVSIDDFSRKFDISTTFWNQIKCSCDTKGKQATSKLRGTKELNSCDGFGDNTGKLTYKALPNNEANHNYEYPGIHRSLLFGVKALQFYFSKQNVYKIDQVTSGYRCRFKNYKTTNHQGKAIDIQFSKGEWQIRNAVEKNLKALEDIRDSFYIKYLGAQKNWPDKNLFSTEPIGLLYYPDGSLRFDYTFSWLHVDVRQFESIYLEDKYFCKNANGLNGKSILQFAKEAGFDKICTCLASKAVVVNTNVNTTKQACSCEDKFKKVAPIILKHEGGYVNHPSDKGGPTNKGITEATWNKYALSDTNNEPTLENLKKITDDDATKIYWKRYWEPKGFCKIVDERVSLMIYDWTITSGGAIKQVQKLLVNEFDQKITVDGGIGNETITAINNIQEQDKLLKRISEIRKTYYTDLTYTDGEKNEQDVFLKGWLARVDDCLNFKP